MLAVSTKFFARIRRRTEMSIGGEESRSHRPRRCDDGGWPWISFSEPAGSDERDAVPFKVVAKRTTHTHTLSLLDVADRHRKKKQEREERNGRVGSVASRCTSLEIRWINACMRLCVINMKRTDVMDGFGVVADVKRKSLTST